VHASPALNEPVVTQLNQYQLQKFPRNRRFLRDLCCPCQSSDRACPARNMAARTAYFALLDNMAGFCSRAWGGQAAPLPGEFWLTTACRISPNAHRLNRNYEMQQPADHLTGTAFRTAPRFDDQ